MQYVRSLRTEKHSRIFVNIFGKEYCFFRKSVILYLYLINVPKRPAVFRIQNLNIYKRRLL